MNNRALTFPHQTRLAINVIIEDDTGVLVCSMLLVTTLFSLLWQLSQLVLVVQREGVLLITDLKAALDFTTKVFAIGFNSLAYGLGIR